MKWYWKQYTQNNKTLSRKQIEDLFLFMEKEGHLSSFFYDLGEIYPHMLPGIINDLIEDIENNDTWFYACFEEETNIPLAFAYANNFIGKSAMSHFCFSNEGLVSKEAISKEWLKALVNKDYLSSLIGLTPRPYRHALGHAKAMGFIQLGIIPQACYIAKYNRYVDGVITQYINN